MKAMKAPAIEAVNEYLGTYSEGIRKLEQRWAKRIALKGNGMKSNGQIFIPGSPKYMGPRTVFIIPRLYEKTS